MRDIQLKQTETLPKTPILPRKEILKLNIQPMLDYFHYFFCIKFLILNDTNLSTFKFLLLNT